MADEQSNISAPENAPVVDSAPAAKAPATPAATPIPDAGTVDVRLVGYPDDTFDTAVPGVPLITTAATSVPAAALTAIQEAARRNRVRLSVTNQEK